MFGMDRAKAPVADSLCFHFELEGLLVDALIVQNVWKEVQEQHNSSFVARL